ncbi:uncharacterized protein LTR77_000059 [Saxophila tyrrhenica]|uniref:Sfi1 spindle body domain-containing protein n=1 Tax=Saxophila tyrrhenica TaxID=1690608 RepID=A0AAV9PRF8_9PEZI|nr:hypothetical protein LTR77_000059 [Saxophila tyrrhenica]
MNDRDDYDELPYLDDPDVELLYEICKRASGSHEPPFKALFAAYDEIFAERGLEGQRDGAIFRYLMRVGESTRGANRERRRIDLVQQLKGVLEALGITVLGEEDNGREDATTATEDVRRDSARLDERRKRRVSFDEARYEETWLSEHTQSVHPSPTPPPRGTLLKLPPRRGRIGTTERRARSTSARRPVSRQPEVYSNTQQHVSPSAEGRYNYNPADLYPSRQELDMNAEAFLSTCAIRSARSALHHWYGAAIQIRQANDYAFGIAIDHDRRALLQQSYDAWRAAYKEKRELAHQERHWKKTEERARRGRDLFLIRKVFTHWATSTSHEKLCVEVARRQILRSSYFNRWRAIAAENQAKARSILCKKYLAIWREKVEARLLAKEQAVSWYEETLLRKCKKRWFWQFCGRRVEGWHEQRVQKRTFDRLDAKCQERQDREQRAEDVYCSRLLRRSLSLLAGKLHARQTQNTTAQKHCERSLASRTLHGVGIQAKLDPIARTVSAKVDLNTARKALRVWRLHLSLSQQAAEVDHQRLLQTAWTNWNDALRCRALAQKINERVLVENLYRWVLQERLRLFQRTIDGRILGRAMTWWRAKVEDERDQLANAEIVFAERQRRRRLAFGMVRLNITMRAREDAERAAVEFSMSRALPKALEAWKDQTDHARRLAKWAADARFYCLTAGTLKNWREKTTEHVADRRRAAYVQVRARIKIRLARECLIKMRASVVAVRSMEAEAERKAQVRSADIGVAAFEHLRQRSARYRELDVQATEINSRKLLSSALEAMRLKHTDYERMAEQAQSFKRETELAVLADALRRVQWANFTAARKVESAEALWLRNRDQHIKQMLRHWATQTAARRSTVLRGRDARVEEAEPESPSLRPASRAASRSRAPDRVLLSSPPSQDQLQSTPGYMRTPSRPRRAGRFRPLPTPATFTPLAFDTAYLATVPAPLPNAEESGEGLTFDRTATEGLTPQITPFSRKLRAGGIGGAGPLSALRRSDLGRSVQGGTNKSVRFAGAGRFRGSDDGHLKSS